MCIAFGCRLFQLSPIPLHGSHSAGSTAHQTWQEYDFYRKYLYPHRTAFASQGAVGKQEKCGSTMFLHLSVNKALEFVHMSWRWGNKSKQLNYIFTSPQTPTWARRCRCSGLYKCHGLVFCFRITAKIKCNGVTLRPSAMHTALEQWVNRLKQAARSWHTVHVL